MQEAFNEEESAPNKSFVDMPNLNDSSFFPKTPNPAEGGPNTPNKTSPPKKRRSGSGRKKLSVITPENLNKIGKAFEGKSSPDKRKGSQDERKSSADKRKSSQDERKRKRSATESPPIKEMKKAKQDK